MAAIEAALPGPSIDYVVDCAAAAAPAAKPRPSALCRAKDKVAVHVSALSVLHAQHPEEPLVEFSDAATRCLQELLHGRCVSSVEMARLHRLSLDHSRDDHPGMRALLLLGGAVRSLSVARNSHYTVAAGLEPDEYGLPRMRMKPPRYYKQSDENTSPGGTQTMQQLQLQPLQPGRIQMEPLWEGETTPPAEEISQIWYTSGQLTGMTGHVDVSRLPPLRRERRASQGEGDAIPNKRKHYPVGAPAPPFQYKCDAQGNPLVKSEMMGDQEFFDHQVQMRALGNRYEAIARTGEYEDRFIMKQIGGVGKIFECDDCGEIFPNRHKFAAHRKYAHPRTTEKRPAATTERSTTGAAAAAEVTVPEREKRERRAPLPRDEIVSHSSVSPPLPASTTKIYTCPLCEEILDTQHKFAAHMRYKHPKGSVQESMDGRRAAVTKVQNGSPSVAPPSPLFAASSSKTTASGPVDGKPVHFDPTSTMTTSARAEDSGETKQFWCTRCSRCFPSAGSLATHMGHHKRADGIAVSSTVTPSEKKKEGKEEEETEKFSCGRCGRCFPSINSLGSHTGHCRFTNGFAPSTVTPSAKEEEESGDTGKYVCRVCGRCFPSLGGLGGHSGHCNRANGRISSSTTTTPVKEGESEDSEKYACRVCGRCFSSALGLGGHTGHCNRANGVAPSTVTTSVQKAVKKEASTATPSKENTLKKEEETPKKYACRVCARPFDNYNSLAGHTRHCMKANSIDPSPRAMQIRSQKAAATAAATTPIDRVGKKEALPLSPLVVGFTPTPPVSRKRAASTAIKEEEDDGFTPPKPPRRTVTSPAVMMTPIAFGKVLPLLSMATRSSRSRASTVTPQGAAAMPSPLSLPLASPSLPITPAKRGRPEATPIADREVKQEEPEDEEEMGMIE